MTYYRNEENSKEKWAERALEAEAALNDCEGAIQFFMEAKIPETQTAIKALQFALERARETLAKIK